MFPSFLGTNLGRNLSRNLWTNLGIPQIGGRICPEIWGQIWGFPKFGDEFVPKFGDKFGDSTNLGKKFSPNLRTNLGNHQIWGRICPESWGLIWGFTKFGDEFVPKFEDKFGDSPILGTNLSLKLGKNLAFSQNLDFFPKIWHFSQKFGIFSKIFHLFTTTK